MSKIMAVALLDIRRLAFGLVSAALIVGLVPALTLGMGAPVFIADLLAIALALVGLASGGYFGSDFADGRGSFFFARPLSAGALISGRFLALLALATATFAAIMSSNWLSTSDRSTWSLWILERYHAEILLTAWSVSLFGSLAIAAQGRGERRAQTVRDMALVILRITLVLAGVIAVFGLFADLILRAYLTSTPVRLFAGSWIVGLFIASCVGIVAGRTERLRVWRFQNAVMLAHLGLTAAVVLAAWTYVLHPGPEAIEVVLAARSSPDGQFAYLATRVDRGDPTAFKPIFVLDLGSGGVRRFNADPFQGPWPSRDGKTVAWSEATPYFFRPMWKLLGGASSYRVQTSGGAAEPFDLPTRMMSTFATGGQPFENSVDFVLPSSGGDVLAVLGRRNLAFVSRTRGEQPDVQLGPDRPSVRAMAFVPSGSLRVVLVRNASPEPLLEFVDIDPRSNAVTPLVSSGGAPLSLRAGPHVWVYLDRKAERALVLRSGWQMARSSLSLVRLEGNTELAPETEVLPETNTPHVLFLEDGRIAVLTGSRHRDVLRIFSASGALLLEIPLGQHLGYLAGEMFPGVVAVHQVVALGTQELVLINCDTGEVIRRIPRLSSILSSQGSAWLPQAPQPGTPGARLLHSADRDLYQLETPLAEPRLLLSRRRD